MWKPITFLILCALWIPLRAHAGLDSAALDTVVTDTPTTINTPVKTEVVRAMAKSDDGKITYIEEDTITTQGNKIISVLAKYWQPDGKSLMAELTSDFSKSRYLPDSHFIDHRTGYEYKVELSHDKKSVAVSSRDSITSDWEKTKIAVVDNLMTLQGAFVYVGDHVDELKNNKTLHIHFLIPSRKDFYRLEIAADSKVNSDTKVLQLKMELESLLLNVFAPNFRVTLDSVSRHVQGFKGVSNILDSKHHLQRVVVDYR